MEPDEPGADASTPGYFGTRLAHDPNRAKVWQHLTRLPAALDPPRRRRPGAGRRLVRLREPVPAAEVVAMDLDATVERAARRHVTAVVGDCTDLSRFADGWFDVVFASNLLEHLDARRRPRCVAECDAGAAPRAGG